MDEYGNPIQQPTVDPDAVVNPPSGTIIDPNQAAAVAAQPAPVAPIPGVTGPMMPTAANQPPVQSVPTDPGVALPTPQVAQPLTAPVSQVTPQPAAPAQPQPVPQPMPAAQPVSPAPAPPAQPQPAFMDPNHVVPGSDLPVKSNGKKKLMLGLLIAAIVLLLGAGAAFAYVKMQEGKPENVTAQAVANTFGEKQIAVNGGVSVVSGSNSGNFSLAFKSDAINNGYEFSLDLANVKSSAVTLDNLNVGLTARLVKNEAYFKVDNLKTGLDNVWDKLKENVGEDALKSYQPIKDKFDDAASQFSDKWIKIPTDVLAKSGLTCLTDYQVVTKTDQNQIAKAYKANNFFTVKANHGAELLDGVKTNHYTMSLNQSKLNNFSNSLKNVKYVSNLNDCVQKASGLDTTNVDQSHTADSSKLTAGDIDYWISAKDKKFSQVKVPFSEAGTSTKTTLEAKFSYGNVAKIEAPVDAMSWADFLTLIQKEEDSLGATLGVNPATLSQGLVNGLKTDIPNVTPNQ